MRDLELELNVARSEWDEAEAVERAVPGSRPSTRSGVRTVVDLTVPGLGRDVRVVAERGQRVPVKLVASTGWYTRASLAALLPAAWPGRPVDGPDQLAELFVRDIEAGIAGTPVRAGDAQGGDRRGRASTDDIASAMMPRRRSPTRRPG